MVLENSYMPPVLPMASQTSQPKKSPLNPAATIVASTLGFGRLRGLWCSGFGRQLSGFLFHIGQGVFAKYLLYFV